MSEYSEHSSEKQNLQKRFKSFRKLWGRLAVIALLIAGFAIGIPYYLHAVSHESTDDAFVNGHIIPISPRVSGHVAGVYVTDNQWVRSGDLLAKLDTRDFQVRLDAARAAMKAARAVNHSRAIEVNLTRITSDAGLEEAQANVSVAQAMVETAQAQAAAAASQREQVRAQIASARASLEETKADAASTKAEYKRNLMDLKRYQKMAKTKTVSQQQLDHAVASERMSAAHLEAAERKIQTQQAQVEQAEAALKAAEDNVHQAQGQIAVRKGQLEQAKARLASAHSAPQQVAQSTSRANESEAGIDKSGAEVEQAELNLSYTRICAPADGYVTKKSVEPGSYVQVGQSLMSIVPPEVWVTANFKETQLNRMQPGQPVQIEVDTYPDVIFRGHVDSIQRGTGARFSLLPPENATGNYVKVVQRVPVKIVFDRDDALEKFRLVPGMSVVPEVDLTAQTDSKNAGKTARIGGSLQLAGGRGQTAP